MARAFDLGNDGNEIRELRERIAKRPKGRQ
jgi:hypothetical protein